MKMTINQARKLLPNFAVGLGMHANTVTALRDAVMQELEMRKTGENQLEPKQINALRSFLLRTK